MTKRTIVLRAAVLAAVAAVFAFQPDPVQAQFCDDCVVCTGGGHHWGWNVGTFHSWGNSFHGCGNESNCGVTNMYTACGGPGGGPGPVTDATDWMEQLREMRDAEDLLRYESLDGRALMGIVARSDGRFFINHERGSLQQRHCEDQEMIVANLPLSAEQLGQIQVVLAEDR